MAKKSFTQSESDQAAIALQALFASKYVDKKKLYWENFVRGLTFSIGGIIGATVGIAIILWFLGLFSTVPLIGPAVSNIEQTIKSAVPATPND